jgi:hypothetical protein
LAVRREPEPRNHILNISNSQIHTHQGYVHNSQGVNVQMSTTPLPSLSLSSLDVCHREVASLFHLPLAALASPTRVHAKLFRGQRPYWTIDVSDLAWDDHAIVIGTDGVGRFGGHSMAHPQTLEVWGLTGWYLSQLMKVLDIHPWSSRML